MNEAQRIERLTKVLNGSGATVSHAFGIWALNTELSDDHISQLAGWADLDYLIAGSTKLTNASLTTICSFQRLTDLSIGNTAITGDAIACSGLPEAVQSLGLQSIPLPDGAIDKLLKCCDISVLNVNRCNLSASSLTRIAELPRLQILEALGTHTTPESSRTLSRQYPQVLFRLRDGLWQDGICKRRPFPREQT